MENEKCSKPPTSGGSINEGTPIAGWFTMENAMNMDGLGVPLFQETSICLGYSYTTNMKLLCSWKAEQGPKTDHLQEFYRQSYQLFHRIEDMPFHPLHSSTGWWFQPLWKILVSWGYYSQYMGKNMFQTTNQSILMRFELDQLQYGLIITDDVRPRDVWNDSKVHMANLKYALSLAGWFMYPAKLLRGWPRNTSCVFFGILDLPSCFFSYPHCMFAGFSWLKHGQSWIAWFFLGSGWYIFPLSKDPSSWFTQVISTISPCVVGSIQSLVDPGIPIFF